MSRSIHTTRRTLRELRKQQFADPKKKADAVQNAREQLTRKRRIKAFKIEERDGDPLPVGAVDIERIPIEMRDESRVVHHGVSEADIRAVLALLPPDAVEGISAIHLALGKEYNNESRVGENDEADPFTGRRSGEIYPGVYSGVILGTYFRTKALIRLYAFVYDPENLPLPSDINSFYLRLHVLATLVHEVAHHHDARCRVRRGRWLSDRRENNEHYAEKKEYEWMCDIVVPYLKHAYRKEVERLITWTEERAGIRLPLDFFVDDPRTTNRNGMVTLRPGNGAAFRWWVAELPDCADLDASRMAFAWELHYTDQYDLCLELLEKILAQSPSHLKARECQADTLIHLDRVEEARVIVLRLLLENAANSRALEILADVHYYAEEWKALLETCERWEECDPEEREAVFGQAAAYLALGREEESEREFARFMEMLMKRLAANLGPEKAEKLREKRLQFYRKRLLRWAKRTS